MWQALATAAVVAASGSRVPGRVSSMATIAPRPRTSPITSYVDESSRSRAVMTSPMCRAAEHRSCDSIVSMLPSAAAQATGLPP